MRDKKQETLIFHCNQSSPSSTLVSHPQPPPLNNQLKMLSFISLNLICMFTNRGKRNVHFHFFQFSLFSQFSLHSTWKNGKKFLFKPTITATFAIHCTVGNRYSLDNAIRRGISHEGKRDDSLSSNRCLLAKWPIFI